tara:strand:+ start:998 stop:1720 length:723 start_codon:yes stop_codon:yes gene_type:complete
MKYLKYILIVVCITIINSCATQTSVINSLNTVKKSILKIETWIGMEGCDIGSSKCPEDQVLATGTGAVVLHNNEKHVLTAAHICVQEDLSKEKNIKFYFKAIDQYDKTYIIEVVNYDVKSDVCLLKSNHHLEPPFIPLSFKSLEYGEKVYNLAAPVGVIEKDMVPVFEGRYFGESGGAAYFSIPAIGGSSGSPIVNVKGELVGMVHSVHYRFHHITLGATYQRLWNFLNVEKVRIIQVQN